MIVQRRVFKAKIGQAPAVVSKIKEFIQVTREFNWGPSRVYTDYLSGETDRVAWEFEVESLGKLEELYQTYGGDQRLQSWFESLMPLIEGAHVESWTLE